MANWWESGDTSDYNKYAGQQNAIEDAFKRGEIDEATKNALKKQTAEQKFGAKSFDINEFEGLLSRLEGSKGRQLRQKAVEDRRNIYAQGIANMMGNF